MSDGSTNQTVLLQNLWDDREAAALASNPLELLRYRSNLLGEDLRITNFGGGNTSSKFELPDPLTGERQRVMAVKGSGGDLRSIAASGFALLYLDRLEALIGRYRGEAHEDEIVALYPLCAFGENRVAASIDTPLHAFLPFPHVDHLHPDWAIALAASANGAKKLGEFNRQHARRIVWVPWQRPGFELALVLQKVVEEHPGCDGIILGGHGLFTWGMTQQDCYSNSIRTIGQMGEFIQRHEQRSNSPRFGGPAVAARVADRESTTAEILPYIRGAVSSNRRVIGHVDSSEDALTFANSKWAEELCGLGTSCPDHFLRTRISPMFIAWDPAREDVAALRARVDQQIVKYREDYATYYRAFAEPTSPALRDSNPSVVVIPGLGLLGFGKDKREARITTEFFVNAIHVMRGAIALEDGDDRTPVAVPQVRRPDEAKEFRTFHNYVALPRREAFRIEYWALEEAKLRRMPPEKEFSRKVALVVGGGSGIGREAALEIARRGGHVVVADANGTAAAEAAREAAALSSKEMVLTATLDLTARDTIAAAIRAAVLRFGGFDCVINTAAIYATPDPSSPAESVWSRTLAVNVTSNFVLAEEAATVLKAQGLPASIVLTGSANAVVPKAGSEPYDVSKAAISHLIRELAIGLGPLVRVNGIAPATVIEGSAMFPRDRVIVALKKYNVAYRESDADERLRAALAEFYAQRTITKRSILPIDAANAICWLAGDQSAKTTGHVIPVDGGLAEAFLR
ncbi:MAG TPA: bifunctional rhamnulose-1-phosphate aldolase/short-chain dehydrogenase [Vicinamibacterales bacterium]|nr:bifunctional rhamnulose-1-phosphate aldolase/short-chain dehydrogenase [Vicinamibacterales bacterium]